MGEENPRDPEGSQVGVRTPRALGCTVSCLFQGLPSLWSASLVAVYFWRGHTGIKYKEPVESCPRHAVRCDGMVDCKLKTDELGCGMTGVWNMYATQRCAHMCVVHVCRVICDTCMCTHVHLEDSGQTLGVSAVKPGNKDYVAWVNHRPSLGLSLLMCELNHWLRDEWFSD